MKTTSQVITFSVVLLLGLACESPNIVIDNRTPDPAVIVGRIVNWTFADSMTIQATSFPRPSLIPDVIASARVMSDGSFSLTLSDPPLAAQIGWGFPHNVVTDTSARFVCIFGLDLSGPSRSRTYAVQNGNMEPSAFHTSGYFTTFPVFADRSVVVSGADTIISPQGIGAPNDTVVFTTEVRFVKGWNRIVARQIQERENLLVASWRSEDIRSINWYIRQ